jgi:prolyl oligopeptidase
VLDLRTDNPASREWQVDRTAETLTALHAVDGYAEFGAAVLQHADAAQRWVPVRAGDVWFQQVRLDPAAELPAITVREAIDAAPRVLVDPNRHADADGPPVGLTWMSPSPDGRVLAYAMTTEGTEINEVHLVDVATGRRLPDAVPWNVYHPISWLPDGSGFWCATRDVTGDAVQTHTRRIVLGDPAATWTAPLPEGLVFPHPEVSEDGGHVAIVTGNTEVRVDCVIDTELRVSPLLEGVAGMFKGVIRGDDLYAVTDNGASRNRIVRIPLASSTDLRTWSEVLPESADVVMDFEVFGDTLVVAALRDCSMAIDVVDLTDGGRTAVPLPGRGGAGVLVDYATHPALKVFERGTNEITFLYSDFATSTAIYRYLVDERRLECLQPPATVVDDVVVSYVSATSADGVEVPMHVIHRADLDLSEPHPTLVYGYGGFNMSYLPGYVGGTAAWIEAGGIYVLAHLRGGGEFGSDWWHGGRRDRKQNTFDDLYAVAEHLIGLGWTSRSHLAVHGASNGGLLTAVALTQRPDLWAAVVSDVPITDLVNFHRDPLTYAIGRDEYGDPRIPEEREWLAAIDPLVNAAPADYPATLVVAGANDPRCPAAHARLLTDVVRGVQTGDQPILLRVHADQGHGTQGAGEAAARLTEILAFCAAHTGLALAS